MSVKCACGCGLPAPIATSSCASRGLVKGAPLRFVHGHNAVRTPVEYVIDQSTGCWNWARYKLPGGYGQKKASGRSVLAHRHAWEAANGRQVPEGLHVLHRCDNRACVNPAHLFLGTNADNVADKVAKGRQARGDATPRAKLTADDVVAIRSSAEPHVITAAIYGVSASHVANIRNHLVWRHVK